MRPCARGLSREQVHEVALGEGVRVVAGMCVDAAFSGPAVERARARSTKPLKAEDRGDECLKRVAKREVAAVGGGGGAAAALRSVAEGARDAEGGVAFPLVQDVRWARAVDVGDVAVIEVRLSSPGLLSWPPQV